MKMKIVVSGGGTGGHIFPALSIAQAIRNRVPEAQILFIGAEHQMEMEKVPAAGYKIYGLPVSGFHRDSMRKNVHVIGNLIRSLFKARSVLRAFRPDVAVGVGGFASGPTLYMAQCLGVPTLIQEQNSYAGVTNKLLARKASKICVAYPKMERFFKQEKIVMTGNPVRQNLQLPVDKLPEAYAFFNITPNKRTVLIIGGSLGAMSINDALKEHLSELADKDVQVIWQTGKRYYERCKVKADALNLPNVVVTEFIARMDYAYAVADLVVSRAGASSISELCLLAKPVILIPSPNVAEDHQTCNAMALVNEGAAVLVKDDHVNEQLIPEILRVVNDQPLLDKLSQNVSRLAQLNSADRIVDEVFKLFANSQQK